MTTDPPTLAPGMLFADRYQIVRPIGEGAFGAVFEARMQPMMRRVALKVLHAEAVGHAQIAARFVREARILGELEHPNVVSVIDVGLANGAPFLVMELLEGETLAGKIRRDGPTPLAEALSLWLPICAAVQAIHERGIVHRDLKPDNIMLARQATGHVLPKILDFGIAKSEVRDGVGTRTSAVMGTPSYMSPEQATDSKNIDGHSDQWALAVILWEILTGRKLFQGPHQVAILSAVLSAPIPPIGQIVAGATPTLEMAFARALEREPAMRYATVRDFAATLLPLADASTQVQWGRVFGAAPPQEPTRASMPPAAVDAARPSYSGSNEAWATTAPLASTQEMAGGAAPVSYPRVSSPSGTLQPVANTLPGIVPARSSRTKVVAAVAVVALLAVAGVGLAMSGSSVSPAAAVTTPATFRLNLRTVPESARIDLDGQPAGSGTLTRDLPRDGRSHSLRVSADGYEPEMLMFADVAPAEQVTLRRHDVAQAVAPVRNPPVVRPVTPPVAAPRVVEAPLANESQPNRAGRVRRPQGGSNFGADQGTLRMPAAVAPRPATGGNCPNGQCVF
jgi:serine/threonine-protein kinase